MGRGGPWGVYAQGLWMLESTDAVGMYLIQGHSIVITHTSHHASLPTAHVSTKG